MSVSPFPNDDASVLLRLVECAQRVLALHPTHERERIDTLCDDVRRAIERPCDGERVMHDEMHLFAQAIVLSDAALHAFDRKRAMRINRAIAALLPDIQEAGHRAMVLRNARPTA